MSKMKTRAGKAFLLIVACVSVNFSSAWADSSIPGALLAQAPPAQGQPQPQPTNQERVAMLKQWLQNSQANLRFFQWVETTIISKDGEEKSRSQNQCYYGNDGKVQKTLMYKTAEEKSGPPGVLPLGKLANKAKERKKEEVTDYMKSAAALVHGYVPPDSARIQQAMGAGKVTVAMVQPGRLVQIDIKDYLKPGDQLSVQVELPTNRLVALKVASYVDSPADAVGLNVGMGVLPDGTMFASESILDAKAKGIRVTVRNDNYLRLAK